ncbi:hypothetical protein H9P43_002126 [Blastocladiella emersonii ATCC 22665]|nr:hypothetical protein H9P43_002126 [Blastocladiella emersonii ATCC 22665]
MGKHWMQRCLSFLFDLAFSLSCDNEVADYLEFLARAVVCMQFLAFVMPPWMTAWNAPRLQSGLQWFVLSFGGETELYVLLVIVVIYGVVLLRVCYDVYNQGIAPKSRHLRIARFLHALCSTVLFIPIAYTAARVLVYQVRNLPNLAAAAVPATTAQIVIFFLILIFFYLIPIIGLTTLNPPDYSRLTMFTRISSRQQVALMILKVALAATYRLNNGIASIASVFAILCLILLSQFFVPMYGSGMANVMAIAAVSVPVYIGAVAISLLTTVPPGMSVGDHYYLVAAIGFVPFAALVVGLYMLRIHYLVAGHNYWVNEFNNLGYYWATYTRSKSSGLPPRRVLPQLNTHLVLQGCKLPTDTFMATHLLLFMSRMHYAPQLVEFCAQAMKKFPDSTLLQETAVVVEAYFSENTAQHRGSVQNTIRKLLGRNLVYFDMHYTFYRVLKAQISTFRLQDDLRKASNLEIGRYIHNLYSAKDHHTKALRWSCRFWKLCSSERPNLDSVDYASGCIQRHQTQALRHYHTLLENFPTSLIVLRTYASFVTECMNNQELAEEIMDYTVKLQEDRAELKGGKAAQQQREALEGGGEGGGPSSPDAKPSLANRRAIGARSSTMDMDDGHSEHTRTSSHAAGSDVLSSLDTNSIFDVESFEDQRNAVAMKGVRRLAIGILASFLLLLIGIIVIFVMGGVFLSRELVDRANVLDAGSARLGVAELAWNARGFGLALSGLGTQSAAYTQSRMKLVSGTTQAYVMGIFNRTASEPLNSALLKYWQQQSVVDVTTGTALTPLQFLSQLMYKTMRLSTLTSLTNTTLGDSDLQWVVSNALPASFLNFAMGFVSVFQSYYEANVDFRVSSMRAAIIAIAILPACAFIFIFLPVWLQLSREVAASRRLYARIPRRVAQVLNREMNECLKEQLEREGIDGTDLVKSESGTGGEDRNGGGGGAGAGGGDAAGGSGGAGGGGDEWRQLTGDRKGSRDYTMWYVLVMYLIMLGVTVGVGIGLSYCFISPLELAADRASIINYSGARLSMTIRATTELRELSLLAPDDDAADAWRTSILGRVNDLMKYNEGTLYGNTALGLRRTFGVVTKADEVTFARTCPATNASAACMSLEESIVTFVGVARRIVDQRTTVSARDMSTVTMIGDPMGILRNPLINVRLVYSTMNQDQFDLASIASIVLFVAVFPLYIVVGMILYRPLNEVTKMIRRIRNILFQLPESTIDTIPQIRDYLNFGSLNLEPRKWSLGGKKKKASPVKAADDEEQGRKRTRSKVLAEANRKLREEDDGGGRNGRGGDDDGSTSDDGYGYDRSRENMDAPVRPNGKSAAATSPPRKSGAPPMKIDVLGDKASRALNASPLSAGSTAVATPSPNSASVPVVMRRVTSLVREDPADYQPVARIELILPTDNGGGANGGGRLRSGPMLTPGPSGSSAGAANSTPLFLLQDTLGASHGSALDLGPHLSGWNAAGSAASVGAGPRVTESQLSMSSVGSGRASASSLAVPDANVRSRPQVQQSDAFASSQGLAPAPPRSALKKSADQLSYVTAAGASSANVAGRSPSMSAVVVPPESEQEREG